MSFHWTNIISFNSSQNDAFEELICQLAKKELIENKKNFVKVGNPDGGVECYIVLENEDEIGFQAKWFLTSLQETQWNQIEESFKTALEKHPKLNTYYVAIPLDRADPKIDGKKSMMDKWNNKVEKWKKFSKDTYNKDINFMYWGSSELIERLLKEENTGLKSFFFGAIDLSDKWFKNQNELAIADLGARYTPEINVELDIVENFDALSRTNRFKSRIDRLYHETMVAYRKSFKHLYVKDETLQSFLEPLSHDLAVLEALYNSIIFDGITFIDFEKIKLLLESISDVSYKLNDALYELNQKEIKEQKIETSKEGYGKSTKYDSNIRDFRDFLSSMHEFKEVIDSRGLKLVNSPFMILDGAAGIGKSHLLADVVNERIKENSNSIFLLGQQFREDKNPWTQILDLLGMNKFSKEELLGALNTKAELQNKRLIIFIDAINEGKGRNFWNEFLISFIETVKKYEWLGLVLSIRSSYFDLIVPKKVFEDNLAIPITHFGFEGIEYNASKLFFKNYNILQPSIPLLHPEFSNPLFLKLFCEGLNKKGYTHIPDGYEGITHIIRFFIEGVEEKLLKKYPNIKSLKLIDKTINVLIPLVLKNQTISYTDALSTFIEQIESKWKINPEFLDDLITEGLFTKNLFYNHDTNDYEEGVYFAYERFEDHLKVKYLFDNYLDNNPKESFKKEPLSTYFSESNFYYNRGIIDAMSIQLPERASIEIIDVVEQNEEIIESFLDSLLWRKVDSITPRVVARLMKNIDNEHIREKIYKTLFSAASNPKHPLNGNLLFEYLSKFTMRDRDLFLNPLLNSIYLSYEANPITRLIDWSWLDEDKGYISDKSIFLTAITLSWLLISSNRKLRDYATKAMISLLQNRVNVVISLLKKFENINEPYIYERLFAITYGVVIRLEEYDGLKELGEYIYNTIFNKDEVYPHILLRDYAKTTIDYISYLHIELEIDFDKVKPPYKSFLPKIEELPTNEDIDAYQDRDKNYNQSRIISSMMTEYGYGKGFGGYGDFGRYVFGSALYHFECRKSEQLLSNYATKKIFEEYGYDGELFDNAEKSVSQMNRNYNRRNHSIERIGKKYQWIAFYDTLARVTDNFIMFDPGSWGDEKEPLQYKGSFEPSVRDIDPTILIKETKIDRKSEQTFWWTPKIDLDWNMENRTWVKNTDDLPNPQKLLEVTDTNDHKWIVLCSYPDWDEPIKKGYDRYETVYKGLWYQFRSYFVPKNELNDFQKWAKDKWFWNNWMPESKGRYQMFSREHYWSEAYKFFQNPYYGGHEDWTNIDRDTGKKRYLHKIGMTVDEYSWEEEFDYSKESSFGILKPSKLIFDGLNMKYSKRDGELIDENNKLICFEASVYSESHQCLLVKKENLFKYLEENDLTIVWTVIGEKQIYTPMSNRDSFDGYMQISGYSYLDKDKINLGTINVKITDDEKKMEDIVIKGAK
jgi:hypothetical protein